MRSRWIATAGLLVLATASGCQSGPSRPAGGDFLARRQSLRPSYDPYPVYRPSYDRPSNPGGPQLNGYAGYNYPPLFGRRRRVDVARPVAGEVARSDDRRPATRSVTPSEEPGFRDDDR